MNRDTDAPKIANCLANRAITTFVKLGMVQIKGLKDLVWSIHDNKTHNQRLIVGGFGQVTKRSSMTKKLIEKERAETDSKVSGPGKFKLEYFEAAEDDFHNLLSKKRGRLRQRSGT